MLPLTELGQGRQGQPNGGGSEMGMQPPCWNEVSQGSSTLTQNAPTYREVPTPTMEGWF